MGKMILKILTCLSGFQGIGCGVGGILSADVVDFSNCKLSGAWQQRYYRILWFYYWSSELLKNTQKNVKVSTENLYKLMCPYPTANILCWMWVPWHHMNFQKVTGIMDLASFYKQKELLNIWEYQLLF